MSMCDYSLDFVASWPATVGDKLVTTKFKNSVNRGFARAQVQSDWPFECFNDCISSRSRPNWPLRPKREWPEVAEMEPRRAANV
jgi:hypothetical protein